MRADASETRHGMTHQPADVPIPVGKRMNVIETMVSCRHRDYAAGLSQAIEAITRFEIGHEVGDAIAGRRQVTTDGDLMLGVSAPFARLHDKLAPLPATDKHLLRRITIKLTMQPTLSWRRSTAPCFSVVMVRSSRASAWSTLRLLVPARPVLIGTLAKPELHSARPRCRWRRRQCRETEPCWCSRRSRR